ncbi:hypothetical protein Hanom_Chr10g00906401 [Helianthus anomalus]
MPKERKFKMPLAFFTRHPYASLGDILCWGWFEDLKVNAIKREFGVQYLKYLVDIKTLLWWGVQELCQTKLLNYGIRFHEQRLWMLIKYEARHSFPNWKPHYPKKTVKTDSNTGEKDITLHIKRPRVMRNMSLRKIEQDSYEEFRGWYYDPEAVEAIISLRNKETWMWRGIRILDPMWLVNLSKKDVEWLFFTMIWYLEAAKVQAMQFQNIINLFY